MRAARTVAATDAALAQRPPATPPRVRQDTRLGILLMIATTAVFSAQDGISRHLAGEYNTVMVVTIRYWAFALFATVLAARSAAGLRRTATSAVPWLQMTRGLLLAAEICVTVVAFVLLGLVRTHAVFACYPLLVAALSGVVLGEQVGWRRWCAIGVGFLGILVILRPGSGVVSVAALVPLAGAAMFALYGLLTRYAGRTDAALTSFFWTGTMGAVAMTVPGVLAWEPMSRGDWGWMATLCLTGVLGHWLLIRTYEVAEASAVQPFAYLQLVFVSILGITIFGEVLTWPVATGAAIVTAAGVFTLLREAQVARRARLRRTAPP